MSGERLSLLRERYLQATMLSSDDGQVELAIEKFCSLVRSGYLIRDPKAMGTVLVGLLVTSHSERVRRWSLNAIALLGKRGGTQFIESIKEKIIFYQNNPHILRYAIAALFALSASEDEVFHWIKENGISLETSSILASSPFSKQCKEKIFQLGIKIDTADDLTLQNASILVGIGQMPEGLFSGRHPFGESIKELNRHDDRLVKSYSVWAVMENPVLSVDCLGVNIQDIETLDHDVQKWVYPTIAADNDCASKNRDIITAGSMSSDPEMKQNLAGAMLNTYFPDFEDIALDWYANENNREVQLRILGSVLIK